MALSPSYTIFHLIKSAIYIIWCLGLPRSLLHHFVQHILFQKKGEKQCSCRLAVNSVQFIKPAIHSSMRIGNFYGIWSYKQLDFACKVVWSCFWPQNHEKHMPGRILVRLVKNSHGGLRFYNGIYIFSNRVLNYTNVVFQYCFNLFICTWMRLQASSKL